MEIGPIQRGAQETLSAAATPAPERPSEQRELVHAVKAVNESAMLGRDNELLFQRDPETHRMVMRVVNRKTGDVVSQVPPETVLRLAASLRIPR